MATVAEWVEGARVRTLPAAVAPVLVGTAVSLHAFGSNEGARGPAALAHVSWRRSRATVTRRISCVPAPIS